MTTLCILEMRLGRLRGIAALGDDIIKMSELALEMDAGTPDFYYMVMPLEKACDQWARGHWLLERGMRFPQRKYTSKRQGPYHSTRGHL